MRRLIAITLGVALAGVGTIAIASRNPSGTYSLPGATNPVTAGSTITTTWANGTMNDIASALTDSLDRNGNGGMLAPMRGPDGTISAPAISFTNETGMGFYRYGSGTMTAVVGSAASQDWTTTATNFPLNVGLTKAGAQTITKSGSGTLTIYNSVAAGNVILTAGVGGYIVAGSNVAMGNLLITNLADPVSAQDAATKNYVDSPPAAAVSWTQVTGCTGLVYASRRGIVYVRGSLNVAAGGAVGCSTTIAAGSRPATTSAASPLWIAATGAVEGALLVATNGTISTIGTFSGASMTVANFSYPAEQ
jgi:hypothetical protein